MDSLNYHHLRYFWVVAREGSIALACDVLQLTQPCISKQIHQLERSLGDKLFRRVGRNLALTERGQLVFRYADEIFSLGRELTDVLSGRPSETRLRLLVGVPDVLPKLVAYRLLEPACICRNQFRSYAMRTTSTTCWRNLPRTGSISCSRTRP